jgi:hypothetical protein
MTVNGLRFVRAELEGQGACRVRRRAVALLPLRAAQ